MSLFRSFQSLEIRNEKSRRAPFPEFYPISWQLSAPRIFFLSSLSLIPGGPAIIIPCYSCTDILIPNFYLTVSSHSPPFLASAYLSIPGRFSNSLTFSGTVYLVRSILLPAIPRSSAMSFLRTCGPLPFFPCRLTSSFYSLILLVRFHHFILFLACSILFFV
jgi:hypothetical protein